MVLLTMYKPLHTGTPLRSGTTPVVTPVVQTRRVWLAHGLIWNRSASQGTLVPQTLFVVTNRRVADLSLPVLVLGITGFWVGCAVRLLAP